MKKNHTFVLLLIKTEQSIKGIFMIKLAYIYRLLFLTGLFLTITATSKMSAAKYTSTKTEINPGNHSLLKIISSENFIADIVDDELTDDDLFHQPSASILKANIYRFSNFLQEEETTDFTKLQIRFYKFPHLFILFHCWKHLCL